MDGIKHEKHPNWGVHPKLEALPVFISGIAQNSNSKAGKVQRKHESSALEAFPLTHRSQDAGVVTVGYLSHTAGIL
jgi:hypothetical protein